MTEKMSKRVKDRMFEENIFRDMPIKYFSEILVTVERIIDEEEKREREGESN